MSWLIVLALLFAFVSGVGFEHHMERQSNAYLSGAFVFLLAAIALAWLVADYQYWLAAGRLP